MGEKMMTPGECFDKLLVYLQRFSELSPEGFNQLKPFLEIRR